jgi:NADH-quinone oxidoreductase subunit L
MQESLLPLIIGLPLLGFVVLGLAKIREPWAGYIGAGTVLASFVLSLVLLLNLGVDKWAIEDWLPGIPLALLLDNLSGVMALVVTGVGFLIHVYAIGYMHGDPGFGRFFGYFNLFIAAMLVLILGDTFPVVFIGWEGVGLASYLLIGFWYSEKINADSARKAFIVNRIGDLGFLLGMGLIWFTYNTLSISELKELLEKSVALNFDAIALISIFLLIGAIGKSAQVPLMVWLPDAMAGPTPVSALIHAATMVTAGVYLLVRSSFMLELSGEAVQMTVIVLGLITAVYGALCSLGQWDIKRIVAYTTLSQLGFMFVVVGVGEYWVAIFHVATHAFFKALLFMTSGAVIHSLGGEQDVRKMGGLWSRLPITRWHALIGTLASGGLVMLAGFWSKDAILASSFALSPVLWVAMLATSALAALYSVRWFVLVFLGEYKGDTKHVHESPSSMLWPNHVLAVGSLGVGFIGLPYVIDYKNFLSPFLNEAIGEDGHHKLSIATEWTLIAISAVVAMAAMYYGYRFFQRKMPPWYSRFQTWALQGFYMDNLYNVVLVNPLKYLAGVLLGGDKACWLVLQAWAA